MDSSERVLEAPSAVWGVVQDASCVALEDKILTEEFPRIDDAFIRASLVEVTDAPPPRARRTHFAVDGTRRPPDRLVLSSYVELMEWSRHTKDAPALDQESARALINY